jgi:hypothetical protein
MAKKWINEDNPLKFTAPEKEGLYMVGSTNFNPITDEKLYFIKIGQAKNLKSRMKNYQGTNPLMYHIAYNTSPNYSEQCCHNLLQTFAQCPKVEGCNEWFKVNREQYLFICEQGFKIFDGNNLMKLHKMKKKA